MTRMLLSAAVVAAVSTFAGPAFAESHTAGGDAAKGEKVFKKCRACHMVGEKAKNRVGPALNGVIGRKAGSAEGYKYSKLLLAAAEAGLVWGEKEVVAYVANPTGYLKEFLKEKGKEPKGKGKMAYKLKKGAEDVTAYIATFSEAKTN